MMITRRAKLLTSLGIGAGLLGIGLPAAAQSDAECLNDFAAVESKHLGVLEHMGSFELRGLSTLRNAARVLATNDQEEACEELVEAVSEILAGRREELVDAGLMVEVGEEDRMAQLQSASRIEDLAVPLRAGDLIGKALRNMRDEYLGEISDVVFDPEGRQMTHALVEVGGFLGLGEEIVAVPLSALRVSDNLNTFILDMGEERFAEAPRLESTQLQKVDDRDWREQNDLYYSLTAE
jgi:sporulation protein YlmC with PRC-barrel domain